MPRISFRLVPQRFLGVDIGTSAVKIVELSRWGERIKLENYGEIKAGALFEKPFRSFERSTLTVSTSDVAKGVTAVLEEAKIKTKEASFCIPDFSTFFTWFRLPAMSEQELAQAVQYEARQHIPLPLSEVTLDWQMVGGSFEQKTPLEVLLVTVPNEIVSQYQEIASLSGLKLVALEAEVFGLARSSVRDQKETMLLIDLGAQSTSISLVDGGHLKRSHSLDMAGNQLTAAIAQSLNVDFRKASLLKEGYGLSAVEEHIDKVLMPLVDLIIVEMDKVSQEYNRSEGKDIAKIILSGGTSFLPGLKNYIADRAKKPVEITEPFKDILCPPILEEALKKMGPSYAVAVGVALRGLQ